MSRTPLIRACSEKNTSLALALIAFGESNPTAQDESGNTALIYACYNNMPEVALALIATGESNPSVQNNNRNTALLWACSNKMQEVALALIATGESNPGAQNHSGATALATACINNLQKVALAIVATGEANIEARDKYGYTALYYIFLPAHERWQFMRKLKAEDRYASRRHLVVFYNQFHPKGAGTPAGSEDAVAEPCPNCIRNGPYTASGLCNPCTAKSAMKRGGRGRSRGSRRSRGRSRGK